MLGVVLRGWCCRGNYKPGEHAEVTAGKMVPEALSAHVIKVRFLDTPGRHVWKELRNGVCKEGLAYLEWAGRSKENCKSKRKKMTVGLGEEARL